MTKPLSTFEREMQDPKFNQTFTKTYTEFLLSELMIAMMENDGQSVRKLAKSVGLSPTVIQNIRSGKQHDLKLKNFINISHACGFRLHLVKGKRHIVL